jgi:hypothetical protein
MEKFYRYLVSAGLDPPREMPLIGTSSTYGMSGTFPGPTYLDSLRLPTKALDDPMAPVRAYGIYSFGVMLDVFNPPRGWVDRDMAAQILDGYFITSFQGKCPTTKAGRTGNWVDGLWDIRQRYGQNFADRLAAFTLRTFHDFSWDEKETLDVRFYNSLMAGEFVLDDNLAKMPEINKILESRGLVPATKH